MAKSKDVIAEDSENEFEVDEPEEVGDHSDDDDWNPNATTKTPAKRGRPPKSTSGRRKKAKAANDDNEDEDEVLPERAAKSTPGRKKKVKVADDEEEEEILPKKNRGAKPMTPTPAAKGRGRAAKEKSKIEEEPEEEDDFFDDEDDDAEDDEIEDEEDMDEEEEEEEEELNQGPNAKPAKKFTSGAFVVLKTDMIVDGDPPVWKIDGKALLQKYIPFKQDGKLLYKNTSVYSGWGSNVKEQYYSAPVSFIQQTRKEHIIEFFKDKIKKDPEVEEAAKKELEDEVGGAEDDDDDEDEDEEDEKAEQDEA